MSIPVPPRARRVCHRPGAIKVHQSGASDISSFFFFFVLLDATAAEVVPRRQYFARMIGQKAASSGPGVCGESGCTPREEDQREGRCSLRSLTPRYNGAPGYTGKIMAVNLWTDSIGFHLSPFFFVAAPSRYLFFFASLPPAFPSLSRLLSLSRLSSVYAKNPQSLNNGVHDPHLTVFPANIYPAFEWA